LEKTPEYFKSIEQNKKSIKEYLNNLVGSSFAQLLCRDFHSP